MTPEEANDLIDAFEAERPEAARLAQLVSLAVRIEPELVRAVRLRLLTEVDAGAEADLWFSPLVQTQSPSLMILVPAVAESLRNRLAKNQELLGRVWDLLREFHRDAPPALRLEEEVTWLALSGNEGRIEERLRSVLAAMKNERRSGLARWATRALPSLPGKARDTEAARILSLVAGVQTGVGPVLPDLPRTGLTQAWLNQAVAKNLGRALIGVRLLKINVPAGAPSDDGEEGADLVRMWQRAGSLTVEFSYPPVTAAEEVEVPDTYRLLLELSWRDAGGEQTRRVSLVEGETLRVEVGSSEVTMHTVLGDAHTLRPHFEYDIFLAYNRSDEAWAERLVKRLETQPRPAGPLKIISSTLDHDYSELLPHWSEVAFLKSRKVGFVLSPASLSNDLPTLEALSTLRPEPSQERRWLIPILLRPVELPAMMKDIPPVNFVGGRSFEAGFSALWTAVTGESLPVRQVPLPMGTEQQAASVGLSVIYSHSDAPLYRELLRHLRLLVHEEVITLRGDFDIDAGGDWRQEIESALSESRIVLLLVSPDFLASDYT
ncbi:MAG: toll/interleukin-1 receptor domain-containing protein, partial [Pyrinomonadaceae bacterium]